MIPAISSKDQEFQSEDSGTLETRLDWYLFILFIHTLAHQYKVLTTHDNKIQISSVIIRVVNSR